MAIDTRLEDLPNNSSSIDKYQLNLQHPHSTVAAGTTKLAHMALRQSQTVVMQEIEAEEEEEVTVEAEITEVAEIMEAAEVAVEEEVAEMAVVGEISEEVGEEVST